MFGQLDLHEQPLIGYRMASVRKVQARVTYGGDHIALRPTGTSAPWMRDRNDQLGMPRLKRRGLGLGKRDHRDQVISPFELGRDGYGKATLSHFWLAEPARSIIANDNGSRLGVIGQRHI